MTSGLFTRLTFKVSVETEFGDAVFVTGNAPILGEMSPGPCCTFDVAWPMLHLCPAFVPAPWQPCSQEGCGHGCPGGLESRPCTLLAAELRPVQLCVGFAACFFARPHLALLPHWNRHWCWLSSASRPRSDHVYGALMAVMVRTIDRLLEDR